MLRWFVYVTLALGSVAGTPAHAAPGAGERVDLAIRPSTLESVERTGPLTLPRPRERAATPGQYIGPYWVDGVYAQHLKELPSHVRRAMAHSVGPTMIKLETPRPGMTSAGGGVYARF